MQTETERRLCCSPPFPPFVASYSIHNSPPHTCRLRRHRRCSPELERRYTMSEAVRAAVAARRAEVRRQQQQQQQQRSTASSTPEDPFASIISPFGSPKSQQQGLLDEASTAGSGSDAEFAVAQRPLDDILFRSCTSGKVNLSSRHPALRALPTGLFSLLDANAPQWYEVGSEKQGDRRAWYEREDLKVLQAANGEIDQIDARIAEFRGLARLEVRTATGAESYIDSTNL